ncbi:MAG TPA: helix-turn-helix domain-containing protein [Nitrososphaerales archaeon]|nr:helix-turn-helix domain-containing protein [Nitrososphaerales archaeon]
MEIILRDVIEADLPAFFNQQLDQMANFMAAFTSRDSTDRNKFMGHWANILSDKDVRVKKVLLVDGQVAGHVARYSDKEFGEPEVTYWIGRKCAVQQGYYQVPRKVRFGYMSERAKIPRTTYEEHVRQAESKIIQSVAPYLSLFFGREQE